MYGLIGILSLGLFLVFYFTNKNNDTTNNSNINFYNQNGSIKKEKEKTCGFQLMLSIGVFLIILASIIFATSTWKLYSNFIKVLILGGETLLFFVLGILLKYVFKVKKTGNALTLISTILLPTTFLCAGYFNLFGNLFSLTGKYSTLFLSVTFLMEALVTLIRKNIIKSNKYLFSLICFFAGIFLLIYGIIKNVCLTFVITSFILMLINIFKNKIFNNLKEFNIFNILVSIIFTFAYFYFSFYQLFSNNLLLEKLYLVFFIISLSLNFIISRPKDNEVLNIFSVLYETMLVIWFVMFSKNLLTASFAFVISGLISYIVYYISNNNYVKTTSVIVSYIQGFLGIFIICFVKECVIMAPIISFIYIVLTFIGSLNKDKLKIINIIFEPIYLIMLAIGILIQPFIIKNIKAIDVIMVINACLIIATIVSTIRKNKVKNCYLIILIIGLFIQSLCSYFSSVMYFVTAFIIYLLLIIYSLMSKDEFSKNLLDALCILSLSSVLIGLNKYTLISSLITTILLIIFSILNKTNNKKYLYLSLVSIPMIMIISNLSFNYSIKKDLSMIILIPSLLILTRKFLNALKENDKIVLEFIFISTLALSITSPSIMFIYLILLYVVALLLKKEYTLSSKTYFNYLIFFSIISFLNVSADKLDNLYMIGIITLLVINQILFRILYEKRNIIFEAFHSIISLVLIICLINNLGFNNFISSIISIILFIILYLIYADERMKYTVISFVVYPLNLLLKTIDVNVIKDILSLFIYMIPITLLLRKVFNVEEDVSNIIEGVILSLMFVMFIFNINLQVGLTLGIISVLSIIIGLVFKYKSYNITGYVTLVLTVIIQTFELWGKMPWWVYLLITGIILIVLAALRESKKK
ncbi:MAG: hypothetical protein ACLUD7_02190 [Lachnospiraceae bacterium]